MHMHVHMLNRVKHTDGTGEHKDPHAVPALEMDVQLVAKSVEPVTTARASGAPPRQGDLTGLLVARCTQDT